MAKKIDWRYQIFESIRYTAVGTSSTLINLILIYAFTEYLHVYYVASGVSAYILSGIYNFYFNKTWTFREKLRHKLLRKYLYFLNLNLWAYLANAVLLYLFTDWLHIYYVLSQFLAIILIAIINFAVNKFVIFRKH